MQKYISLALAIFLIFPAILIAKSQSSGNHPMPILSKQRINKKFMQAQKEFEQRWKKFAKNRSFNKFDFNFNDEDLLEKFAEIKQTRNGVYYENPQQQPLYANESYERAQDLLFQGFHKAPHLIAFEYNYSHPSYNSSNVTLNGHRFLALEGPQKPQHTANFLRLLVNYDVKHVVRLTNDYDKGVFKSQNYWKDTATTDDNGKQKLSFRLTEEENDQPYAFNYYAIDDWGDHAGADPQFLLNFVQNIRKQYKPGEIIAVHCSAGIGRTGTFIAAFLMLEDIDQQLAKGISKRNVKLSIEELVYKLSLQRAYMVGEPIQYVSLHKLAKIYLRD